MHDRTWNVSSTPASDSPDPAPAACRCTDLRPESWRPVPCRRLPGPSSPRNAPVPAGRLKWNTSRSRSSSPVPRCWVRTSPGNASPPPPGCSSFSAALTRSIDEGQARIAASTATRCAIRLPASFLWRCRARREHASASVHGRAHAAGTGGAGTTGTLDGTEGGFRTAGRGARGAGGNRLRGRGQCRAQSAGTGPPRSDAGPGAGHHHLVRWPAVRSWRTARAAGTGTSTTSWSIAIRRRSSSPADHTARRNPGPTRKTPWTTPGPLPHSPPPSPPCGRAYLSGYLALIFLASTRRSGPGTYRHTCDTQHPSVARYSTRIVVAGGIAGGLMLLVWASLMVMRVQAAQPPGHPWPRPFRRAGGTGRGFCATGATAS